MKTRIVASTFLATCGVLAGTLFADCWIYIPTSYNCLADEGQACVDVAETGCSTGCSWRPGSPVTAGYPFCIPANVPNYQQGPVAYGWYSCNGQCPIYVSVRGAVEVFGGRIGRWKYEMSSPEPELPMGACEYLLPGWAARFRMDPPSQSEALAPVYNWWIQDHWVDSDQGIGPCGAQISGGWDPGYHDSTHVMTIESIDEGLGIRDFRTPGMHRITWDDGCEHDWTSPFVVTSWGHYWSGFDPSDEVVLAVDEERPLDLWMEPWWLDKEVATLEISDPTVIALSSDGIPIDGPVVWAPPHAMGVVESGGSSLLGGFTINLAGGGIAPIADRNPATQATK